jgi:hypothetical protein
VDFFLGLGNTSNRAPILSLAGASYSVAALAMAGDCRMSDHNKELNQVGRGSLTGRWQHRATGLANPRLDSCRSSRATLEANAQPRRKVNRYIRLCRYIQAS